jgi:hypothetical protein
VTHATPSSARNGWPSNLLRTRKELSIRYVDNPESQCLLCSNYRFPLDAAFNTSSWLALFLSLSVEQDAIREGISSIRLILHSLRFLPTLVVYGWRVDSTL